MHTPVNVILGMAAHPYLLGLYRSWGSSWFGVMLNIIKNGNGMGEPFEEGVPTYYDCITSQNEFLPGVNTFNGTEPSICDIYGNGESPDGF